MSGSHFLVPSLPYEVHEQNYHQAIAALGLTNATPEERIRAFLETPGQDIVGRLPPSILTLPAVDGDLVASVASFAEAADSRSVVLKGKKWCEDLMVGDAQMDVSLWSSAWCLFTELTN